MCRPTCESVCATAAQFIVMCLPYISLGRTACLPIHRFDSVSFCTLHLYKLISSSFSLGVYFLFLLPFLPSMRLSLSLSNDFQIFLAVSVVKRATFIEWLFCIPVRLPICLSGCLLVCFSICPPYRNLSDAFCADFHEAHLKSRKSPHPRNAWQATTGSALNDFLLSDYTTVKLSRVHFFHITWQLSLPVLPPANPSYSSSADLRTLLLRMKLRGLSRN